MFSKAKANKAETRKVDAPPVSGARPDGAAPAGPTSRSMANAPRGRGGKSGMPGVPSIISADMIIRGSMESAGEVQFEGEIDGNLKAKSLVVGEGARVVGEIIARKVRVSGQVEGAITAVEVELAATAAVKGDILTTSLSIESGATFDGNCRHTDNPLGDPAEEEPATSTDYAAEAPTQAQAQAPADRETAQASAAATQAEAEMATADADQAKGDSPKTMVEIRREATLEKKPLHRQEARKGPGASTDQGTKRAMVADLR